MFTVVSDSCAFKIMVYYIVAYFQNILVAVFFVFNYNHISHQANSIIMTCAIWFKKKIPHTIIRRYIATSPVHMFDLTTVLSRMSTE